MRLSRVHSSVLTCRVRTHIFVPLQVGLARTVSQANTRVQMAHSRVSIVLRDSTRPRTGPLLAFLVKRASMQLLMHQFLARHVARANIQQTSVRTRRPHANCALTLRLHQRAVVTSRSVPVILGILGMTEVNAAHVCRGLTREPKAQQSARNAQRAPTLLVTACHALRVARASS